MATRPDLIITDLSLAGTTGMQGIVEFRERCPDSRVLLLTMHDSEEYIRAALSAGALGYVLKDATRAEHSTGTVLSGLDAKSARTARASRLSTASNSIALARYFSARDTSG